MLREVSALLLTPPDPERQQSKTERAFQDTITAFYADPKFEKRLNALKTEAGAAIDAEAWYKDFARQMSRHRYATSYAQSNFDKGKTKNLATLKKNLKKRTKNLDTAVAQAMNVDEDEVKQLKKKLAKTQNSTERGIETWYRLASRNLYTRRQIVDTKSSILLTVNSIILSIALGNIYPQLQNDWHLIYALTPLVLTNIFSITFAVLAIRISWPWANKPW